MKAICIESSSVRDDASANDERLIGGEGLAVDPKQDADTSFRDVEESGIMTQLYLIFTVLFFVGGVSTAKAQTLSFADAIDQIASACRTDIQKYCKGVELGNGAIRRCLDANQMSVSAQCKQTYVQVYASIARRIAAQNNVAKICSADVAELCPGIVPGDANLLNCMLQITPRILKPACNQAINDTGWRSESYQR